MELIDTYVQMLTDTITAEGVYPMPAIIAGEQLTFLSYDCLPQHMLAEIQSRILHDNVNEVVFGFDAYTREGQGTTFDSAVIIFHVRSADESSVKSRIGVWEYSWNGGDPITKPINWENPWWRDVYAAMLAMLDKSIKGH
jgi:hypothetical protein